MTKAEVAKEFKKLKKENFKTEAEYEKFLKESDFTQADVDARVELTDPQQRDPETDHRRGSGAEPERNRKLLRRRQVATQFTQPETRDIRLDRQQRQDESRIGARGPENDDSAKNWKKVAKKYSEDELSKSKGGFQKGIAEGVLEEPLNEDVFNAPKTRSKGSSRPNAATTSSKSTNSTRRKPAGTEDGRIADQIPARTAGRTGSLHRIRRQLLEQVEIPHLLRRRLRDRTLRQLQGRSAPPTAPPACYEANPKTPAGSLPAPVFQLIPAMPGTVTPVEPRGHTAGPASDPGRRRRKRRRRRRGAPEATIRRRRSTPNSTLAALPRLDCALP